MILRDLTLDLPRTAITALVGPSDAGKTSALRLLDRLDDPTAGQVAFDGQPITAYPVGALRRRVGFVFQSPAMFPGTIAMLEGGRLVEAGPTERLFTAPASGRTRAYLATAD